STAFRQEVLERLTRSSDPEVAARQRENLEIMLNLLPEVKQKIVAEEAQKTARHALRRVLARRGLLLSPEEDAAIECCEDLATLERWHDQAVTAASAAEALQ
ncbi:MAG TPA: hypothetical protein VLS89_16965, partial [Candidatus Nanopelagicales bacterium]|nr:hypothetical protein [Candidatus Nanopelagicales bacterium]